MSDYRIVTGRRKQLEERIAELEATIKRVRDVGFDVHPSWGSSDDFYRGWRACRKQIEEALGEAK